MNVSILGGGIAGLAASISLNKYGIPNQVYERFSSHTNRGKGFIVLSNGVNALDKLGAGKAFREVGFPLDKVVLKNTKDKIVYEDQLDNAYAVVRQDFMQMLHGASKQTNIHFEHCFSRFHQDLSGSIKAIEFENGSTAKSDVFIGADGARSRVRTFVTDHQTQLSRVKELVGLVELPEICQALGHTFVKYESKSQGLSFGIVPAKDNRVIWYMQYDSKLFDFEEIIPEEAAYYAKKLVGHWSPMIAEILEKSIGHSVYRWNTGDMDIPERYFNKNCLLLGDALHPFLTFTSQGTSAALEDAVVLGKCFEVLGDDYETVFKAFQAIRVPQLRGFTQMGRELCQQFLEKEKRRSLVSIPLVF